MSLLTNYEGLRHQIERLVRENEELKKLVRLIRENHELRSAIKTQAGGLGISGFSSGLGEPTANPSQRLGNCVFLPQAPAAANEPVLEELGILTLAPLADVLSSPQPSPATAPIVSPLTGPLNSLLPGPGSVSQSSPLTGLLSGHLAGPVAVSPGGPLASSLGLPSAGPLPLGSPLMGPVAGSVAVSLGSPLLTSTAAPLGVSQNLLATPLSNLVLPEAPRVRLAEPLQGCPSGPQPLAGAGPAPQVPMSTEHPQPAQDLDPLSMTFVGSPIRTSTPITTRSAPGPMTTFSYGSSDVRPQPSATQGQAVPVPVPSTTTAPPVDAVLAPAPTPAPTPVTHYTPSSTTHITPYPPQSPTRAHHPPTQPSPTSHSPPRNPHSPPRTSSSPASINDTRGSRGSETSRKSILELERKLAHRKSSKFPESPRESKQLAWERLVGEIAFQLDRRILSSIFPERVRLYGFTVSNIPEKIIQASLNPSDHKLDEELCQTLTQRYVTIMNRLQSLGYNGRVHPALTEQLVNAYGILRERPELAASEGGSYSMDFLQRVLVETVHPSVLTDALLLLSCLSQLARDDGKPMFIWAAPSNGRASPGRGGVWPTAQVRQVGAPRQPRQRRAARPWEPTEPVRVGPGGELVSVRLACPGAGRRHRLNQRPLTPEGSSLGEGPGAGTAGASGKLCGAPRGWLAPVALNSVAGRRNPGVGVGVGAAGAAVPRCPRGGGRSRASAPRTRSAGAARAAAPRGASCARARSRRAGLGAPAALSGGRGGARRIRGGAATPGALSLSLLFRATASPRGGGERGPGRPLRPRPRPHGAPHRPRAAHRPRHAAPPETPCGSRGRRRIASRAGSSGGAARGREAPRHAVGARLAPAARRPAALRLPAPRAARPPPPGPSPALPGLLGPGPAAGLLRARGASGRPGGAEGGGARGGGAAAAAPGRPPPGAARAAAVAAAAGLAPPLLLRAPSALLGAPRALAPPGPARAPLRLPQRQRVPAARRAGALQQPGPQRAARRGGGRPAGRRPAALALRDHGLRAAGAGGARWGADGRAAGGPGLRVLAGGVRPARGAPPGQPPGAQPGPGAVRRGRPRPAARAAPQAAGQRAAAGLALPAAARRLPAFPPRTSRGRAGLQGSALRTEDGPLRCRQLTLLLDWIERFEAESRQSGEAVAFSVLLGDLNFDNCSLDHAQEQEHQLFDRFRDPCRLGTRREQPWALGTILNTSTLHHSVVCSPEMLRRALEQEKGRHRYLAGPARGGPRPKPWRGRRLDYVLYRGVAGAPLSPDVEQVTFSTALAGLTDHLAVGLQLRVSALP